MTGSELMKWTSSALSIFNFRVEGREFGACVVDLELPIDPTLLLVTRRGPRGGFRRKLLGVAKPAVVQTLTRQRAQFVFRNVEPTAVLGRVPTLEPPDQLPCPHRVKRLVKRAHRVRVYIVADHEHFVRLRVTRPQQGLHLYRPIHLGALPPHADMAPSLQRLGKHEHAGRACAFVLVVDTPGMVLRGGEGHAGFLQPLHRLFVHAHHGKPRVIRLRVRLSHVFHARDKFAVGGRRDDPVLNLARGHAVFFSIFLRVSWLIASTMASATTCSANKRNDQLAHPLGGLPSRNAMPCASCSPSSCFWRGGVCGFSRGSARAKPTVTRRCRTFSTVFVRHEKASAIFVSVQLGPFASALRSMCARRTCSDDPCSFFITPRNVARSSAVRRTIYFLAMGTLLGAPQFR